MEYRAYTVVKGDTYNGIAYRNDMSLSDLMELNPQADIDRLIAHHPAVNRDLKGPELVADLIELTVKVVPDILFPA